MEDGRLHRDGVRIPGCIAVGSMVKVGVTFMMRNVVRGILGLVLAAAATWLANQITTMIFGPEEEFEDA